MPKSIQQQQPSHDDIARLAYELWEQNARPSGQEVQFWLQAEQRLRSSAQTAPKSAPPQGQAAAARVDAAKTPPRANVSFSKRVKPSVPVRAAVEGARQ